MCIILIGQLNVQHRRPRHDGPVRARLRYLPNVISMGHLTFDRFYVFLEYGDFNFILLFKDHFLAASIKKIDTEHHKLNLKKTAWLTGFMETRG